MRIGLVGLAGAGKDTAAQIISKHLRFPCVEFAEPIHEAAKYVFGELCLERDVKEIPLPFGDVGLNLTLNMARLVMNDCGIHIKEDALIAALKEAFTNIDTGKIYGELSPRKFMQLFGTEFGRNIDGDLWVRMVENKYETCVISDVRFWNELFVCDVVILVKRDRSGVSGNHISEGLAKELNTHPCYNRKFTVIGISTMIDCYVVNNNGSIEELDENLKQILSEISI
jgi:hypothetical protein|nr:MAG TPA: deoxynucleoside monophosphate kinase [Caudoviricetes sp.]